MSFRKKPAEARAREDFHGCHSASTGLQRDRDDRRILVCKRPVRGERHRITREANPRPARARARLLDSRHNAARILQRLSAGLNSQNVEEQQRFEINIFVESFKRRNAFFVDADPEIRFTQLDLNRELIEVWRRFRIRSAAMKSNHVIPNCGEHSCLVNVPEEFVIGLNSFINDRCAIHGCAHPSCRDAGVRVGREEIKQRPRFRARIEMFVEHNVSGGIFCDHFVNMRCGRRNAFERDEVELYSKIACQHFVDRIQLVEPSVGGIHRLSGAFEFPKADLDSNSSLQQRFEFLVDPAKSLLVSAEDAD